VLNRQVIAQNITNLTDARYFAAWGVDYLSFNMQDGSPYMILWEDIKEIIDWVEGPRSLIEANAIEYLEGIDGHIMHLSFSSLPITKETFFRLPEIDPNLHLTSNNFIIPIRSRIDLATLKKISVDLGTNIFLDISNLDFDLLDELPDLGIVVQGGEEEKVGVKNFDDLDVLYDWLLG